MGMNPNISSDPRVVRHRFATVDGLQIFYREAGPRDAPTLLLLHGFRSASHQFRRLMDRLADSVHLIAPDYPGFGFSELPSEGAAHSRLATFEGLADVMENFVVTLGLARFFTYVFDYGAPIGFRIAVRRPDWIAGIITQNGNVYESGLGLGAERLRPGRAFDPEAVLKSFSSENARNRYLTGSEDRERIARRHGYSINTFSICRVAQSFKWHCLRTIRITSSSIPRGKAGCASGSRRFSLRGEVAIRFSSRRAHTRLQPTYPAPRFICSIAVTSRSTSGSRSMQCLSKTSSPVAMTATNGERNLQTKFPLTRRAWAFRIRSFEERPTSSSTQRRQTVLPSELTIICALRYARRLALLAVFHIVVGLGIVRTARRSKY